MTTKPRRVAKTTIVFSYSLEEWQVKAYDQNGKRFPEADYFTPDCDDAQSSAHCMTAKHRKLVERGND